MNAMGFLIFAFVLWHLQPWGKRERWSEAFPPQQFAHTLLVLVKCHVAVLIHRQQGSNAGALVPL